MEKAPTIEEISVEAERLGMSFKSGYRDGALWFYLRLKGYLHTSFLSSPGTRRIAMQILKDVEREITGKDTSGDINFFDTEDE